MCYLCTFKTSRASIQAIRDYGASVKIIDVSGESGVVTLGALVAVLTEEGLSGLKTALKLDEESRILLINTEGNTDPVQFRQIIWEGSNPVPRAYWTD